MKLHLNGAVAEFEGVLTIAGLLSRHQLKPESVVVEYNYKVPPKSDYSSIELKDGDTVEIVKFMGGG
ncbi:MAG TPA: thiamine biosynthesis protein ThiS [Fibrobacteres bacterium]|jgi:thiamine biosynthesis protein ThiS|nr:thiamine biosynthesis protein ThiS [Fibrobacterota bacterium]